MKQRKESLRLDVPSQSFERRRILLKKIVKDCKLVRVENHGNDSLQTQSVMFIIPQCDIRKIFQDTNIHAPTQATEVKIFFHTSPGKNGGREIKIKISSYYPDTYRRMSTKEHRNFETAKSIVERHWIKIENKRPKKFSSTTVTNTGVLIYAPQKIETPIDERIPLTTESLLCPRWIHELFVPCKEAQQTLIEYIRYHLGLTTITETEIKFENSWGHIFSTCTAPTCLLFAHQWRKFLSAKAPIQWNRIFHTNKHLFRKWGIVLH